MNPARRPEQLRGRRGRFSIGRPLLHLLDALVNDRGRVAAEALG